MDLVHINTLDTMNNINDNTNYTEKVLNGELEMMASVPTKSLTEEICDFFMEKNGRNVILVPAELMKLDYIEKFFADCDHCSGLLWIGDNVIDFVATLPVEEIKDLMLKYDSMFKHSFGSLHLEKLPEKCRTLEFYWEILAKAKSAHVADLEHVPEEFITQELCDYLVFNKQKNTGFCLCYIPEKYRTENIVRTCVRQNPNAMALVGDEMFSQEELYEYVYKCPSCIDFISEDRLDTKIFQAFIDQVNINDDDYSKKELDHMNSIEKISYNIKLMDMIQNQKNQICDTSKRLQEFEKWFEFWDKNKVKMEELVNKALNQEHNGNKDDKNA